MNHPVPRAISGPSEALAAYSVRESRRARSVLLRLVPGRGLEVVVPLGFDPGLVPGIIEARLAWIERAIARLASRGIETVARAPQPPGCLEFRAVGRSVPVDWLPARGRVRLVENAGRLLLAADPEDAARWARALRAFVLARAKALLPAWLARVSRELSLPFEAVRVRTQRTRWGSCSRGNVISLNAKLLFLPNDLAEQVLVHELCHTRRPDHSRRFWALVAEKRPGFARLERELRLAGHYVPAWLEV